MHNILTGFGRGGEAVTPPHIPGSQKPSRQCQRNLSASQFLALLDHHAEFRIGDKHALTRSYPVSLLSSKHGPNFTVSYGSHRDLRKLGGYGDPHPLSTTRNQRLSPTVLGDATPRSPPPATGPASSGIRGHTRFYTLLPLSPGKSQTRKHLTALEKGRRALPPSISRVPKVTEPWSGSHRRGGERSATKCDGHGTHRRSVRC